jgi:hypothetical protein
VSSAFPWTFELQPGWSVRHSSRAFGPPSHETDPCDAIVPPNNDAALRLFTFDPIERGVEAATWIASAAHFSKLRGWVPNSARCGDFAGFEVRQPKDDVYWRQWWLEADGTPLNAVYQCPAAIAGRDDLAIESMLATLKLRVAAG